MTKWDLFDSWSCKIKQYPVPVQFFLFGLVPFNFFQEKSINSVEFFSSNSNHDKNCFFIFFFSLDGYFWGGCSIFLEKGMFKLGFKFWLWCHWLMCAGPGSEREKGCEGKQTGLAPSYSHPHPNEIDIIDSSILSHTWLYKKPNSHLGLYFLLLKIS